MYFVFCWTIWASAYTAVESMQVKQFLLSAPNHVVPNLRKLKYKNIQVFSVQLALVYFTAYTEWYFRQFVNSKNYNSWMFLKTKNKNKL